MSAIGSILSNNGALDALAAIRNSSNTTNTLEAQLSSGKKINSPADNPAGYITAEGFTSQLNGINQALNNVNQGISLLQTAEGALNQQTNILQSMNSIAVQASNGTQTPQEAQSLQEVVGQLNSQVDTIANQTQFNNINLLDGSFSGVDFQVGANNGQTISLSIAGTKSTAIGMYATAASASGLYAAGSSAAMSSAGVFTAGSVGINGPNGNASVAVTATESAASIASAINNLTGKTGVAAQAKTSVVFKATGSDFSFTLGNGTAAAPTNTVNISATSASGLVNAINNATSTTGISAQLNSSGDLVMNQAQGENITISNDTAGTLTQAKGTGSIVGNATTPTKTMIQGKVQFQSSQGFSLTNSAYVGLTATSSLSSLSGINVATASGAETAINVIKYALQSLGAEGGQLGAAQQRLQADANNLTTTSQNLQSARSVVQDANIPQVSSELTQQQILQQAGVSALKSSSTLQQQFTRLLP